MDIKMRPEVAVALCADRNMEAALHVTLYSLLSSTTCHVRIFLLLEGYDQRAIERLDQTLEPFRGNYAILRFDFAQSSFRKYKGLHGNRMMFGRLLLADLLSVDRIIYLDSDLIVRRDISDLFNMDLGAHVVAASGVGRIATANDNAFFGSLGLDQQAPYFNSGVLLIDLAHWRSQRVTAKCFDFADLHPKRALDQTILNYVFYRDFLPLDDTFNRALYPNTEPVPLDASGMIFHFVGAPKPWDLFGRSAHRNYPLFEHVLRQTAFRGSVHGFSPRRIMRAVRLARSYYTNFKIRHQSQGCWR